jgi:2-polyprenyl-3-methyl-5-hydroxy-6-metoxy-1,4-benzoquinol methylase
MPTEKNYELYWRDLRATHDAHPGNIYRYDLIGNIARDLGIRPATIIDCGCGDGSLLRLMGEIFPEAVLSGMDVSASALERASQSGANVFQADFGKPLNAVPEFDLVLCSEVIEHIQNDDMVLDNLRTLCRPGGWIILTTQSGRIYNTEVFLGHLRHYRLADLVVRLENRSFKVAQAFHAGWPWLKLQKVAAHHMQTSVRKHVVEAERVAPWLQFAFRTLSTVYRSSSRKSGPQLVLAARRDN